MAQQNQIQEGGMGPQQAEGPTGKPEEWLVGVIKLSAPQALRPKSATGGLQKVPDASSLEAPLLSWSINLSF